MAAVWLSMFMTSTMPIIQIVVMCAMGAVIARQASFAEVQLVSSTGSRLLPPHNAEHDG